ncbi:MAG: hypothetical protein QXH30_01735 [Candidatus Bilamarchaeaceae archaeon]
MEERKAAEILRLLQARRPDFIKFIRRKKEVRILSIGSARPGIPLRLARAFNTMGIRPTVDFLEPCLAQRRNLLKLLESRCPEHFGKIHPKTQEDLECGYKYDLILSLQIPRGCGQKEKSAAEFLKKTRKLLADNGACPSFLGKKMRIPFPGCRSVRKRETAGKRIGEK